MHVNKEIGIKLGKRHIFKGHYNYENIGGAARTEEADITLSSKCIAVELNKPTAVVYLKNLETEKTIKVFSKQTDIFLDDGEISYKINKISPRDTIFFEGVSYFEDNKEKVYVSSDNSVSVIEYDKFFLIYPRKNIEFTYNGRKFNIIFKKKFSFFGFFKKKKRFYF